MRRVLLTVLMASFTGWYGCTQLHHLAMRDVHPRELLIMRGLIPDDYLDSPQFHDFQRIMVGKPGQAGAALGPGMVLSPVEFIDSLDTSPRWWNVAILAVDGDHPVVRQSGLAPGINCYYLRNRARFPQRDYEARIAHLGAGTACPRNPPNGSRPLFTNADTPSGSVPQAVRLHVSDEIAGQPNHPVYIGVPCYRWWCRLSAVTYKEHLPLPGGGEKNLIAGWHDEQYLTYGSGGTLIPSRVRARLTPVENLDDIKFDTVFREAAIITIADTSQAALAHYRQKWQLPNYNWESPVMLSLRQDAQDKWWAQYSVRGMTSTTPIPVEFRRLPTIMNRRQSQGMLVEIESTARWSVGSDGGSWIRCTDGCCTVS
ncbi:MAG TPA: hypothetical protein VFO52_08535 [Longimicrobiales bacterium]|nr:hypothetical protein [Longimicrobiales bacterium]